MAFQLFVCLHGKPKQGVNSAENEMVLPLFLLGKSMASVGQPGVEASERQHKEGLLLAGTALAPSSVNHSLLFYSDCCSGRFFFFYCASHHLYTILFLFYIQYVIGIFR